MSRGGLWAEGVGKRRAGGGVGGVEAEAGALRWVGGWAWEGRVKYRPGFERRGHLVTSLGRGAAVRGSGKS